MTKQKQGLKSCSNLTPLLKEHLFKVIVFDWVGTAAKDLLDEAVEARTIIEDLLKLNVLMIIVTDLDFSYIDQKVCWPIQGLHKKNLLVCANKGLEVFNFDGRSQPLLLNREEITDRHSKLLTYVAEALKKDIENGYPTDVSIISDHSNRYKLDLIPEIEDRKDARNSKAKNTIEKRLAKAGFKKGIKDVMDRAVQHAQKFGLGDIKVVTDIKHIEISLTDESDSMKWITDYLAKVKNIPFEDILVVGSEFGTVEGFEGKNHRMILSRETGINYVSVGKEPSGVPEEIVHVGGGPDYFTGLMKAQVEINKKLSFTKEPVFLISEHGFNPLREREIESILTVGNGYMGIRGSLEEERFGCDPTIQLAGVYYQKDYESAELSVVLPNWLFTNIYVDRRKVSLEAGEIISHKRTLDLKKGLLCREWRQQDEMGRVTFIRFLRFASRHDPHTFAMRITVIPENYAAEVRVKTGVKITDKCRKACENIFMKNGEDGKGLSLITHTRGTGVTIAQTQMSDISGGYIQPEYRIENERTQMVEEWTWQADIGQKVEIDKFVCFYTSRDTNHPEERANKHVHKCVEKGFEKVLLDNIEEWEKCWAPSFIEIKPDHQAQSWMNFANYHLCIAGNPNDEKASISARALTGTVYQGHIFWDSELFILPFFCFTHPPVARAMLMYRYNTLPAARQRAKKLGYKGALYAWESAMSGDEMTPPAVLAPNGKLIPIGSGRFEHHISSAVAHGVWLYWAATRDTSFLLEAGAEIILETARFWASRTTKQGNMYHIDHVEGPDEYHEDINDNYYTNMMAVWNLEQAKKILDYIKQHFSKEEEKLRKKLSISDAELKQWADIVAHMYRDMDNSEGLIEQFAGYFQLEDIDVDDFEPRTAPMDVILGREYTDRSQIVKQADVVMALYLLEEYLKAKTVKTNFLYYDKRTGHGSSLSPAIYGLVAARVAEDDKAWRYFKKTAMIDLADNMGNAAGGVHIASLGGMWQQVIMGFAGIRVTNEGMFIYPNLPKRFEQMSFSLMWHGLRLHFEIERRKRIKLNIEGKGQLYIGIFGKSLQRVAPGRKYSSKWEKGTWLEFRE